MMSQEDRYERFAYRTLNEFIIALSGSFDLVLDDGDERKFFIKSFLLRNLCTKDDLEKLREFFN